MWGRGMPVWLYWFAFRSPTLSLFSFGCLNITQLLSFSGWELFFLPKFSCFFFFLGMMSSTISVDVRVDYYDGWCIVIGDEWVLATVVITLTMTPWDLEWVGEIMSNLKQKATKEKKLDNCLPRKKRTLRRWRCESRILTPYLSTYRSICIDVSSCCPCCEGYDAVAVL